MAAHLMAKKTPDVDNSRVTVDKSVRKTVPTAAQRAARFKGRGDPRNGRGPKKGAPNAGRTPDAVRALSRAGYLEAVPKLRQVARGEHVQTTITLPDGTSKDIDIRPDAGAMSRAADILGKYGGLTHIEVAGDPKAPLIIRFEE